MKHPPRSPVPASAPSDSSAFARASARSFDSFIPLPPASGACSLSSASEMAFHFTLPQSCAAVAGLAFRSALSLRCGFPCFSSSSASSAPSPSLAAAPSSPSPKETCEKCGRICKLGRSNTQGQSGSAQRRRAGHSGGATGRPRPPIYEHPATATRLLPLPPRPCNLHRVRTGGHPEAEAALGLAVVRLRGVVPWRRERRGRQEREAITQPSRAELGHCRTKGTRERRVPFIPVPSCRDSPGRPRRIPSCGPSCSASGTGRQSGVDGRGGGVTSVCDTENRTAGASSLHSKSLNSSRGGQVDDG